MELFLGLGVAVHLRDRLDAGCDERLALARLDRVERHPDRLQARRAEAVHRRARHRHRAARRGAPRAGRGSSPASPAGSRSRPSRRRSPRAAAPAPVPARRRPRTRRGRRGGRRRAIPWPARPIGVRAVETITASGMRPSCRNEKGRRSAGPSRAAMFAACYRSAPRPLIRVPERLEDVVRRTG